MKKLFLQLIVVLLIFTAVAGCSKKTEEVTPEVVGREGKWDYQICLLVNGNPQQCETGVYTFDKNGTGSSDVYGSFTWVVNGDKITLTYSGGANTYTISEAQAKYEKWLAAPYAAGTNTLQQRIILNKK